MAGAIRTPPVTKAYEDNFDRAMKRAPGYLGYQPEGREPGTVACEHCGRVPKYADQVCACTLSRRR